MFKSKGNHRVVQDVMMKGRNPTASPVNRTPIILLSSLIYKFHLRKLTAVYVNQVKTHFPPHGATAPSGPGPPHYRGFTMTLRHTTLGRTPLSKWSARRRDPYLTSHSTHNRQTSMPPAGFELTIPASKQPQTHAYDRAVTGNGWSKHITTTKWQLFWLKGRLHSVWKRGLPGMLHRPEHTIPSATASPNVVYMVVRRARPTWMSEKLPGGTGDFPGVQHLW